MKIIVFSDVHCDVNFVNKLVKKEFDYYVLCGDVSDVGDGFVEMGKAFSSLGKKLLVIPGNNETEEQMSAWCKDYGFTNLHKKIVKIGNYYFAGLGQSTFLPFSNPPNDLSTPGEKSEDWFMNELKNFSGKKNLLLFCHEPPVNSKLDTVRSGSHVGSKSIRDFIIREKPVYFFSGHIHECAGSSEVIGVTKCYSVGKKSVELVID